MELLIKLEEYTEISQTNINNTVLGNVIEAFVIRG